MPATGTAISHWVVNLQHRFYCSTGSFIADFITKKRDFWAFLHHHRCQICQNLLADYQRYNCDITGYTGQFG
jgi:hypothetical protein